MGPCHLSVAVQCIYAGPYRLWFATLAERQDCGDAATHRSLAGNQGSLPFDARGCPDHYAGNIRDRVVGTRLTQEGQPKIASSRFCHRIAPLKAAGETYYEFRADLMIRNDEGLTKTYNRFHDPNNQEPDIVKLRELHAAMDRAVLDAYGWDDISTDCEFLLDYELDSNLSTELNLPVLIFCKENNQGTDQSSPVGRLSLASHQSLSRLQARCAKPGA